MLGGDRDGPQGSPIPSSPLCVLWPRGTRGGQFSGTAGHGVRVTWRLGRWRLINPEPGCGRAREAYPGLRPGKLRQELWDILGRADGHRGLSVRPEGLDLHPWGTPWSLHSRVGSERSSGGMSRN